MICLCLVWSQTPSGHTGPQSLRVCLLRTCQQCCPSFPLPRSIKCSISSCLLRTGSICWELCSKLLSPVKLQCLCWVSLEMKGHWTGSLDVGVTPPCHLWVCLGCVCGSAWVYLWILLPQVLISFSCSISPIAFAEIGLLSITTCSILISLVNVTNILIIFFSKLIIIIWTRIESSNFLCEDSPHGFTGTCLCYFSNCCTKTLLHEFLTIQLSNQWITWLGEGQLDKIPF